MDKLSITSEDKAWTAGILDGEGCICSYKNGSSWVMRVVVANTSAKMINRLHELWGGCVYDKQVPSRKAHWKPIMTWEVWSNRAKNILEETLPYLVAKKDQAEIGLKFFETLSTRGIKLTPEMRDRRERLAKQLKDLKKEKENAVHSRG